MSVGLSISSQGSSSGFNLPSLATSVPSSIRSKISTKKNQIPRAMPAAIGFSLTLTLIM